MHRAVLAVIALVLIAGCMGPFGGPAPDEDASPTAGGDSIGTGTADTGGTDTGGPGNSPTSGRETTAPGTQSGTATADRTSTSSPTDVSTPTPTSVSDPTDNYWETSPIRVVVVDDTNSDRDWQSMVRAALDYWEGADSGQALNYELVEDTEDADVRIRFVEDVGACGDEDTANFVGCAPILTGPEQVSEPTDVRVEVGYNRTSTIKILKHELGHTLGFTHDDADEYPFMSAQNLFGETAAPNASERAWPWRDRVVRVSFAESSAGSDGRQRYVEEVKDAVTHYAERAEGWLPENASVTYVDDTSKADVVVQAGDPNDDLGDDEGSVVYRRGTDPDADGAVEFYTEATVYVQLSELDETGWYVGHELGHLLGASTDAELPSVFQDGADRTGPEPESDGLGLVVQVQPPAAVGAAEGPGHRQRWLLRQSATTRGP